MCVCVSLVEIRAGPGLTLLDPGVYLSIIVGPVANKTVKIIRNNNIFNKQTCANVGGSELESHHALVDI